MSRRYQIRAVFIRWLCVAVLLGWSALPVPESWGAQSESGYFLEICTAQGLERVALAGDGSGRSPDRTAAKHCPLCVPRSAAVLPENPAAGIFPALVSAGLLVSFSEGQTKAVPYLLPAQPRAPPSIA